MCTEHDGVQYLAVSPMPNLEYKPTLGSKQPKNTPGCIQIWGMVPALVNAVGIATEPNRMRCELVLCVEGGPALEIKWMPMGAWDAVSDCELSLRSEELPY
jgi:transcription factor C subunit 6